MRVVVGRWPDSPYGDVADAMVETADRLGKCWGLGSDTTLDPGPWEGEQRNMWKPTQVEALWFPIVRFIEAFDDAELRALYGDRIATTPVVEWSRRDGRVIARAQERLGALVLSDRALEDPDPEAVALAAWEGRRYKPARRSRNSARRPSECSAVW